jgi:hypothetical protein
MCTRSGCLAPSGPAGETRLPNPSTPDLCAVIEPSADDFPSMTISRRTMPRSGGQILDLGRHTERSLRARFCDVSDDGSSARKAAWSAAFGVLALAFGSVAILLWTLVASPRSSGLELAAAMVLSVLFIGGLYMVFACLTGTWPASHLPMKGPPPTPAAVSSEHAKQLRDIAVRIRYGLEGSRVLLYDEDAPDTWQRSFLEHFPGLKAALETASADDVVFEQFRRRVNAEIISAGMDTPPWTPQKFGRRLAREIQKRALSNLLGSAFNFDWHPVINFTLYSGEAVVTTMRAQYMDLYMGNVYDMMGAPPVGDGVQVLERCESGALDAHANEFEAFFGKIESLPEAVAISQLEATKSAIRQLADAANTDPITTRCSLCAGSS